MVLDDGAKFRLLPILGRGSVQAVADILFLRGVDVGIVRKDTLAYLERKGFASNIRNQFGYVTKLYNEEMHIVADKRIRTVQDLDGKSVAVDLPDCGTFVTSISAGLRRAARRRRPDNQDATRRRTTSPVGACRSRRRSSAIPERPLRKSPTGSVTVRRPLFLAPSGRRSGLRRLRGDDQTD